MAVFFSTEVVAAEKYSHGSLNQIIFMKSLYLLLSSLLSKAFVQIIRRRFHSYDPSTTVPQCPVQCSSATVQPSHSAPLPQFNSATVQPPLSQSCSSFQPQPSQWKDSLPKIRWMFFAPTPPTTSTSPSPATSSPTRGNGYSFRSSRPSPERPKTRLRSVQLDLIKFATTSM